MMQREGFRGVGQCSGDYFLPAALEEAGGSYLVGSWLYPVKFAKSQHWLSSNPRLGCARWLGRPSRYPVRRTEALPPNVSPANLTELCCRPSIRCSRP